MKILYLTDTQIRGINSENRVGNYYADVMTKIKEIIDLSKKLKVDKVIHGGDLFDSAIVSNVIVDELIDLIEEGNIPWYVIRGNHDEQNNSPQLSKATSLDHCFRRSKFINYLDKINGSNVLIKGYDYYTGIENDIKEKGLIIKSEAKLKIAVIHAFITEKPFLSSVMHIQMKDINTNFDIVLCSHYHHGWNQKVIGKGIRFINPSCIGRLSIDEIDISPQIVLMDTNKDTVKFIPLKSAKPKEEIFDLTKVQEKKVFEQEIDNFIASLETTKFDDLDIQGTIIEVGRQSKVKKEIVDELLERINREK